MLRRLTRSLPRPAATAARSGKSAAATAPRAAAPAFEQLEQRQLLSTSPVIAGSKIKGINLSNNNISTNQTLITIPFGSTDPAVSSDVTLTDASKIRLFGYATNPGSRKLGQIKMTVHVVKAEVLALDANCDGTVDHSLLQLTTDRLMRKGGTIILNEGALTDTQGNLLATQTLHTIKGQNKERFTLACRAFLPTDFTRFTSDIFSASPNPAANSTVVDETTASTNLSAFLDKKVAQGLITQAQKDSAMSLFAADSTKLKVPPANLRAALISLTGTFASGAIDSFLSSNYTILTFQDPGDATVPVAKTTARSDGKLRTVVRPEFQGEPFQVLSAWLAHEALHQDNNFSLQEEVVASTFGTLVNAQQAAVDSSYLKTPSKLVNQENENLLALVNSGRTIFPYVGALTAPMLNASMGVFPGQKTTSGGNYTSLDDFLRRQYIARGAVNGNTPGNALLEQYYTSVTGVKPPAGLEFSDAIITQIDAFQSPVGTHTAILIAQALRLDLSK
jgi:hypothetical protein